MELLQSGLQPYFEVTPLLPMKAVSPSVVGALVLTLGVNGPYGSRRVCTSNYYCVTLPKNNDSNQLVLLPY